MFKRFKAKLIKDFLEWYINKPRAQSPSDDEIQGCIKCAIMLIREIPKYLG